MKRNTTTRCLLGIILIVMLLCTACAGTQQKADAAPAVPEVHAIAVPEDYPTAQDEDGADAYAGALDHADSAYYAINDYYNMSSGNGLHILSHFDTYQQTTEYTCGAASALMVLHWFGEDRFDELQIGDMVDIDTEKGTSVEGLAAMFEELGWSVQSHADTDYFFLSEEEWEAFIIEHLDAGIPIMVDWVDWGGHWQVVVGLDGCGTEDPYDDVLILADPYDITDHYQDGYYTYPLGRFFYLWFEGPCAAKAEPYVQPFVVASPG